MRSASSLPTPKTTGTLINLGGTDVLSGAPLTLGLTAAELARITAGTLVIGNSDSRTITVSAAIPVVAGFNRLSLITGGAIGGTGSLSADNLAMKAGTGIGTSASRLTTQVANLAASGGTGGIFLGNTGNLTVTDMAAQGVTGLSATGMDIDIQTTSGLNINANVSNTDNLAGLRVQFRVNGVVVGSAVLRLVAGEYQALLNWTANLTGNLRVTAVFLGKISGNQTRLLAQAASNAVTLAVSEGTCRSGFPA